ncbi:MAG: TRAP transporter small permease [Deltaproteobacteria bacterium]|nr:TRAP transporter small permease [Deltaproteobacteria bacterium]
MLHFEKPVGILSDVFNWVAAAALTVMMLLTCCDVVLRLFRHPIPGTYEIVSLLGTVVVAFALAYTTLQGGHIAVEFLVQRFSKRVQNAIDAVNGIISMLLFGIISWQSFMYGLSLRATGEVSLTIQLPIYPFAFGISLGCAVVCLVLIKEIAASLKKVLS